MIKVIVFDSLIGNSDRHQENWGIITYNKEAIELSLREAKKNDNSFWQRLSLKLFIFILKRFPLITSKLKLKFHSLIPNKFAPIYDSGSCLGRELLDEKVGVMLKDENQLRAYIRRGTSEIHLGGEKLTHFNLIRGIKREYNDDIISEIKRINEIFDEAEISSIINNIDKNLPDDKLHFALPEERKKLIIKMISLRFEELIKILD